MLKRTKCCYCCVSTSLCLEGANSKGRHLSDGEEQRIDHCCSARSVGFDGEKEEEGGLGFKKGEGGKYLVRAKQKQKMGACDS